MSDKDVNTVYRRIIIINTKTEKVIIDKCLMGPVKSEHHLREIFANTPELKKHKGKDIYVNTHTVAEFCSTKE